jgi:hypothetical protein
MNQSHFGARALSIRVNDPQAMPETRYRMIVKSQSSRRLTLERHQEDSFVDDQDVDAS